MNLTSKALLVQLNISQWSARKYDKKVTKSVTNATMLQQQRDGLTKPYCPMPRSLRLCIRSPQQFVVSTTNRHYLGVWKVRCYCQRITTWEFMADFNTMKNEWEGMVADFVAGYPQLVSAAQTELGSMYDPQDYPPVGDIANRFQMQLTVMPVPSDDFRVGVR